MASSSSSSTEKKKMIVLMSKEGEKFEVEEAAARLSQTVKNLIEDDCTDGGIPLANIDSPTLAKVVEFCNRHAAASDAADSSAAKADLKEFESDYVNSVKDDLNKLFDLILAANYLDIRTLLDLTCAKAADIIKDKSPEEVRKLFDIKNDFTEEEEAAVRNENPWAYE